MPVPIPPQVKEWEAEAKVFEAVILSANKRLALEAFLMETSSPFFFGLSEGQCGYCIPWKVYLSEGYYFIHRDYELSPREVGTASTKITRKGNRLLIDIPYDDEHYVHRVVWTSVPTGVVKCFKAG